MSIIFFLIVINEKLLGTLTMDIIKDLIVNVDSSVYMPSRASQASGEICLHFLHVCCSVGVCIGEREYCISFPSTTLHFSFLLLSDHFISLCTTFI